MEMYKDIDIGDHRYRIGRLSARTGSWILSLALKEAQGQLSESEYANIQQHLLSVCSRFKDEHPMPILKKEGTFAVKDLEYDLDMVLRLQVEAKGFNFADFFEKRAREVKDAMALNQTSDSTTA
jgi:hypothetical protein